MDSFTEEIRNSFSTVRGSTILGTSVSDKITDHKQYYSGCDPTTGAMSTFVLDKFEKEALDEFMMLQEKAFTAGAVAGLHSSKPKKWYRIW